MIDKLAITTAALVSALVASVPAHAGGSAERVLIVINPASPDSMYLGHYYQFARGVPQNNVVYIDPAGSSFAAMAGSNGSIDGLVGALANKGISKTIDYIVLAAPHTFFVNAPGLVTDACWPVARFSQTSVFAMAFMRSQVFSTTLNSQDVNRFSGAAPTFFSSTTTYLAGVPSTAFGSRRYFVVASLGYTGLRGNTHDEITDMIDSAVASDGLRPDGKFYFMNTTDPIRNVRASSFNSVVASLPVGRGEIINGIMPDFRNDCLGILTGWLDPNVDTAPFTLMPGAFCDHLTSYAATFDEPAQTKMSSWIRRGAAGSCGTVEEPCNYQGKFPAARFHVSYFSGMCLGEAWFRSMAFTPFQVFFQGDPIARPHATLPIVNGNVPSGSVSGPITFTPTASTTLPGAAIAFTELYIDGKLRSTQAPGTPITISTSSLPDGPHEVRILAYDNTAIRTIGSWTGSFTGISYGRTVTLNMPTTTGNMSTSFTGNVSITGPGAVREVRLIQNGRVLVTATSLPAALSTFGRNIGPGKTRIQAEVLYTDELRALSQPVLVDIANTPGTPTAQAPTAFSYRKRVQRGSAVIVELPAAFADASTNGTYTMLSNPAQSTPGASGPGYRVFTAGPNACGSDPFTFRVTTPDGQSNIATVTLVYDSGPSCPADFDDSGGLTANDFQAFINSYASSSLRNDINGDCNLNAVDFQAFLDAFATGCP